MAIPGWCQYFEVKEELQRTPKALLLLIVTGDGEKKVWLPRKKISLQHYNEPNGVKSWQVGVPEWLCEKQGLG